MLLRLIRILILVYLGFGAYLFFAQRSFMYYPVTEIQTDQVKSEILTSDKQKLKIWVLNPGMNKAVIYFGGNAENVLYNAEDLATSLPAYSIYLVNYRGYGGSSGLPSEAALYRDALNVFDQLQSRHQAISAIGRSLGSSVTNYLASQRPLDKIVLVTPFASAAAVAAGAYPIYPVNLLLHDKYESLEYASRIEEPVLFLIAADDHVIPIAHSLRLADVFPAEQTHTVIIEDSGHNTISNKAIYWKSISQFLSE